MKTLQIILFIIISLNTVAQSIISGIVTDKKGEPIPGVNIFIENTYDGASSNDEGKFSFSTPESGTQTIIASYIGYQNWTRKIELTTSVQLEIILTESVNSIDAVTITAGTFAASDKQRAAILQPLDIYTTASANADIMAAMRTMPGAQASADDGRLLVRGGDAYESKTYIDGLLTAKPYYSKTPDVATRGRFSPSLFNGVQFSSGGYSAEYGQALSSVLELNTTDVASSDVKGISIMTIGAEANLTKAFKQSSVMASAGYTNMGLYHSVFHSAMDWTKPVESGNFAANFKFKPNSTGIFKAYVNAELGSLGYTNTEANGQVMNLENKNGNIYSNISYNGCFNEKTCYKIGIASTYDNNQILLNETQINTQETSLESRFSVTHFFNEYINLNTGLIETFSSYDQDINQGNNSPIFNPGFTDNIIAAFAESEIKFNKYIAIRPGVRAEYSTLLQKWNVAPRVALAAKTGKKSQLSAAWGKYYQNPQADYLKFDTKLNFENATHYILSYQAGETSTRLFRTELYHKNYDQLITWEGNNEYYPENIKNDGNGYANGIDVFWKDKKSLKYFEYWLTYSYIDTKRKYENFPQLAKPDFVSDHNFSLVTKYWANAISTQFGTALTIASPRNFDDPNAPEFMDITTNWYHNLSVNMSHVFYLGEQYSVFYVSLSNVLGNQDTLAYRPSSITDAQGNYTLTPVKRDIKRFLFVGLFLSF